MSFDDLKKKIKTMDVEARRDVVRALGENRDREAFEVLIEFLEEYKEIRADILWALGKIGDAKAIPYLLGFLKSKLWQERSASAEALGEIKGAGEVVDALIELLGDGHDTVHWQAAWALGELGDKKAVEPLQKQMEDKNPKRCWHAVWALGKIGSLRARVEPAPTIV